jgi:small subunit ribosomal protein S5
MAKKKEFEEKIAVDEKKRVEMKALEGQKVEKPIEEKIKEDVEKTVEEEIESLKSLEDIEKEVEKEEVVPDEEPEKEADKEKGKGKEVVSESVEKPEEAKVVAEQVPQTAPVVPTYADESFAYWKPKTVLGKEVASGAVVSIDQIIESGRRILEPEIVDKLVPDMKSELILVGGRKGKGGGKQRIPVKITATMHRSGRKFTSNAFAVVGNEAGLVGIGKASALESRDAINKAINKAKMNLTKIKRGCGSWECGCGGDHSIPYITEGKSGSVRAVLIPAPRGLGLVADDQSKKLLRLAGIKDVWVKTYGNTGMRINLITAIFKALKKLYVYDR